MKRLLMLFVVIICCSFCTMDSYPCHQYDTGACTHPMHAYDYYYNAYGALITYPCTHPMHAYDTYPCTHVCY